MRRDYTYAIPTVIRAWKTARTASERYEAAA